MALLLAAILGTLPSDALSQATDWAGLGAALALVLALVSQLELARRRPERHWYDGRALAESIKSLDWQYAVCGTMFPAEDPTSRDRLLHEMKKLLGDLPQAQPFEAGADADQITVGMQQLREASLDERREAYRTGRLIDQREWYSKRARENRRRHGKWLACLIGLQLVGAGAVLLRVAGIIELDAAGIASAGTAGIIAWLQLKDHGQLEEAYSLASHELGIVESTLHEPNDEEAWAAWVSDAEQAISREHRMWRAGRAVRGG